MSNHFDIFCDDCEEELGFHLNHGDDALREVLNALPQLVGCVDALRILGSRMELVSRYGYEVPELVVMAEFITKHEGHAVIVISEYDKPGIPSYEESRLRRKEQRNVNTETKYTYCETMGAYKRHLRIIPKREEPCYSGFIDGKQPVALCGTKTAWDLKAKINEDRITTDCAKCEEIFWAERTARAIAETKHCPRKGSRNGCECDAEKCADGNW